MDREIQSLHCPVRSSELLCAGLNIAPLTERTRNRTAGHNYMGVHRERLEMLNPGRC